MDAFHVHMDLLENGVVKNNELVDLVGSHHVFQSQYLSENYFLVFLEDYHHTKYLLQKVRDFAVWLKKSCCSSLGWCKIHPCLKNLIKNAKETYQNYGETVEPVWEDYYQLLKSHVDLWLLVYIILKKYHDQLNWQLHDKWLQVEFHLLLAK